MSRDAILRSWPGRTSRWWAVRSFRPGMTCRDRGRDRVVTALADTQTSKTSNWGASLEFNAGAIMVGGNTFKSKADSVLYSNAQPRPEPCDGRVGARHAVRGREREGNNVYLMPAVTSS